MASSILRGKALGAVRQARCFSSTPRQYAADVKSLGVLGAGQMGLGIALVAAQRAQVPVTLVDASEQALSKGIAFAEKLLAKDVSKSRITQEQADQARSLLTTSTKMEDFSSVDFIIEAVPEIPQLKFDIFTSSRVVSTHFMNPVPVQKGVEIISGLQTSKETLDTAVEFCKRMGKITSVSADSPGFLANRILMPYINEAIICLETGVGDRDSIDAIMKNGTNVPMGPLQLADFIGLDTCLSIMKVLHTETGDSKYRPSVLLGKMVDAGWLGKKSGKGFYDY
ncbi:hypothetical protein TrVFT333_011203 [Trichoderma virens FT-333]|nr:hypothetical protein TrVFT333_011203 [Trichoderma virens FT-333]